MTTKLNSVQLHLLQLFAHTTSEQDLEDVKQLLTDYYARKADEEMARLQEQHLTSQTDLEVLLTTHLRTPYPNR